MIARAACLATTITGVAAVTEAALLDHGLKIIWNASPSAAVGLYAVRPAGELRVGDLVIVRPPEMLARFLSERDYLPTGVPLLKRVEALPGQTVCREGGLITVDGIARAPARERDRAGRPLPVWQGCRVIADWDVFLLNWDVPDSLDGRYFGPLPVSTVIGRAIPLLTFPKQ